MTRATASNVPRPSLTSIGQRREVKAIARQVEREIADYQTTRDAKLSYEGLSVMSERLSISRQKLALLKETGLSAERPASTIGRSFKSAALLSGAAVTSVAAVPVAAALGVAEVGIRLAVVPLNTVLSSCVMGTGAATMGGIMMPVVLKPVGIVTGCVGGIVAGAGSALVGGIVNTPVYAAQKGSFMRAAFKKIDQFGAACAHVKRKKLSASEIADCTEAKITNMIYKLSEKQQRFIVMAYD